MKENFIEALNEIKEVNITNTSSLEVWKSIAINLIVRVYGNEIKQVKQIESINFKNNISYNRSGGGNNSKDCNEQAKGLIGGFVKEIKRFGLPEKEMIANPHPFNLTLNQHQQQNQSIKLEVIRALKDELKENQLRQIQEIIDNNESIEEKKDSIIKKITSFGSGLASNILASILTSPGLYS
jgi:hypothetical protein